MMTDLIQIAVLLLSIWGLNDDIQPAQVIEVARVIQGEGAHLLGLYANDAGVAIGHCYLNNLAVMDKEAALNRFNGYDPNSQPGIGAIGNAVMALTTHPDQDVIGGALYCVSRQDLEKYQALHRIPEAVLKYEHGPWGLYFFRDYPLGGRSE